jgi:hypothetical protein
VELFTDTVYPGFIKGLDARFIEVLCIEEPTLWLWEKRGRFEKVLGHLENLRTLIFHGYAIYSYLQTFVPARTEDIGEWLCLGLDTLVIHSQDEDPDNSDMLLTLCRVVREKKIAGFPLKSVSVFLGDTCNLE